MRSGLKVINRMPVSTGPIVVLAAAPEVPAGHAQPQIRTEIALAAVSE